VLVVEAFGSIEKTPEEPPSSTRRPQAHRDLLYTQNEHLVERNLTESVARPHLDVKEESQKMFELGILDLDVKARVEELFWEIAERIQEHARRPSSPRSVPDDFGTSSKQLADQHICNFSVFQSLLDHWALGALFPIVPIHRLDERAHGAEHAGGHHVRLRRQGVEVHRPEGRARDAAASRGHPRAAVLPRALPHGRLPGHHGRPAQPLRSRERGPRVPR
jgi:hypothetical protein